MPSPARHLERWLFDLPDAVGGRPLAWLAAPLRYLYALLRDLGRGDLGLRAMSLVYSTLFAIVPVVAVSFSVLKAFGYHRELEPVLYEFLRPLGAQGYELTARIMGFVENVQGTVLGTLGFLFLFYTVITTIQKVEEALNFVWRVERPRSLARRVSEYLIVMLVGPVVMVLAMVMLASVEASAVLERLSGLVNGGQAQRLHVAPYVMIVGVFAFIYVYMPNTRVRTYPAAVGALFAGVLWAAVGALFTRVVVYSAKTMAVYAGFAVVLLFLVWVYLSWLILLLGAQLSYYLQHPQALRAGRAEVEVPGVLRERIAMSLMYLVGERFLSSGPRWTLNALAERLDVPGTVLDELVTCLEHHGVLLTAEDDSILPARDLTQILLTDIVLAVRSGHATGLVPQLRGVPAAERCALDAEAGMRERLGARTLRELIEAPETLQDGSPA